MSVVGCSVGRERGGGGFVGESGVSVPQLTIAAQSLPRCRPLLPLGGVWSTAYRIVEPCLLHAFVT